MLGWFPGSDPVFPRADTGGRGCPTSAVTPQEMASFPHQHDGKKDHFPSSSAAVFDNLDHSPSVLSHRFRIL